MLAYMLLKKLKSTILPGAADPPSEEKNEEAFAELVQFLDDRSLGLVMYDGKDNGQRSQEIL